ncbi:MAG: T9SS type A sorting domain-containing protein, partial [Chitinophagaceae bacterium]|nr:T9SS type A sorting domain-containing protein [Chitinophagaceae bacterium]
TMTYTLNGPGRLLFTFAGINLPDSNTNEPASHGFVQYAIKPKGGLSMNTSIENTASIYFDFNPPIVTNTTQNIIVEAIPNGVGYVNSLGSGIQVYPNPTNGVLMIGLRDVTRAVQFTLYDVQGRVVMQQTLAGQAKHVLDISALNQGIYFIDLVQGQQRFQGKLIKQ